MKTMLTIKVLLLLSLLYGASCSSSNAVKTVNAAAISQAIDSGWTFTATYVIPQAGRGSQPNGVYTVRYSPSEINVYLPYFGRSFAGADAYNTTGPLDFVSKDFTVEKQRMKNDSWRVLIKPRNQPQLQSMTFEIYDNAAANLAVIFNNRSPISYRGTISFPKN